MTPVFDELWKTYVQINPKVAEIKNLFLDQGEVVINDHIALRTFDDPRVSVDVLARVFLANGYLEKKEYLFADKKLRAKHYEHPDPKLPKVFISELELKHFSENLKRTVRSCIDSVTPEMTSENLFVNSGRPWSPINYSTYEALRQESEYAAWMYAWGYMANHFTVKINHLQKYNSVSKVNQFLESHQVVLNDAGGKIKGSPEVYLEQSSTMANKQFVTFAEGKKEIPSCSYEFAFRHKLPSGEEFPDFIADNANKIFESTNMH
jgi:hypothetical protein